MKNFLVLCSALSLISFSAVAGNLTMWDSKGASIVLNKKITAATLVGTTQSGYALHVYAGNLAKDACLIPLNVVKGLGIDPISLSNILINASTDLICWNTSEGIAETINFNIE